MAALSSVADRERQEVVALKRDLAAYLGANAQEYWTCVRNFLVGRASKIELDLVAREYLVDHTGLGLHNTFLKTVMLNATKDTPPPPERLASFAVSESVRVKEKRPRMRLTPELSKRLSKTREIVTISKADRQNIKSLTHRRKGAKLSSSLPPVPAPMPVLVFNNALPSSHFRDGDQCWESKELPGYQELRQRLTQKVFDCGLMTFNDSVVPLLMFALECHLKNILTNCIRRVQPLQGVSTIRLGTLEPDTGVAQLTVHDAMVQRSQKHVLRLEDLVLSLHMAPHLLGENKIHLEKMTNQLYD